MADPDFTRALERLEAKVDRMSDAIVSLARMEERMVTLFNRMDRYDADQREVTKRVAELERVAIGRGPFFRWADRLGAALVMLAAAYLFNQWVGGK